MGVLDMRACAMPLCDLLPVSLAPPHPLAPFHPCTPMRRVLPVALIDARLIVGFGCRLVPLLFRALGWVLAKLSLFPHLAGSADRGACWIYRFRPSPLPTASPSPPPTKLPPSTPPTHATTWHSLQNPPAPGAYPQQKGECEYNF